MHPAQRSQSAQRILLAVLALCTFLLGLDSMVVGPLIPAIAAELHFPEHQGGLLVTAYALLYGIVAPFLGPVSDRIGRKRMLTIGLIVFSMATLLTVFGNSFGTLLFLRALAGAGGAMVTPGVYAVIGDEFDYQTRGRAMGIVMGAMSGSIIIGVPFGTWFAQDVSWKPVFVFVAVFGVIAALLVARYVPGQRTAPGSLKLTLGAYTGQFHTAVSNPSVLIALLSSFLWMAALQGIFVYCGVFYTEKFGMSLRAIGIIYLVAGVGNILGNAFGGRLADRIGKRKVVLIATIVAALSVSGFVSVGNGVWLAVAFHVVWSTANGMGYASLTALISELSPQTRGTVMSFNSSAVYLGMTASTAASAALLQQGWSFTGIGLLCGAYNLLVIPVLGFLTRRNNQELAVQVPS